MYVVAEIIVPAAFQGNNQDQEWPEVTQELNFDGQTRAYDHDSTAMLAVSGFMESIEMGSDPEDVFNRNMKDLLLHV